MLLLTAAGLMAWVRTIRQSPIAAARGGEPIATIAASSPAPVLRLGIVPERDIFQQRKRYQALTTYLSAKIAQPITLATSAAYQDLLRDLGDRSLDAAFAGSFTTVLAADRFQAQILVNPVMADGSSSYRGVIVVPTDSPIQTIADLRGHSLAGVRATMAGQLFPFAELKRDRVPLDELRMVWVGTHDDVVAALVERNVDAGALKEARLAAWEKVQGKPGQFRRLAISQSVPENALLLRSGIDSHVAAKLSDALLHMADDPAGREALKTFGATRFEACKVSDYAAVYEMTETLGSSWSALGIDGPPPKRP